MIVPTIFIASLVSSHAILVNPPPRRNGDMSFEGLGIKIVNFPPTSAQLNSCLNSKAEAQTNITAGNLNVKWLITLNHNSDPGVRVALQYPKENFVVLKDSVNVNDNSTSVLIPNKTGPAILQWLWASKEDGGFYMACSDVVITAGSSTKTASASNTKSKSAVNSPDPTSSVNPDKKKELSNVGYPIYKLRFQNLIVVGIISLFL